MEGGSPSARPVCPRALWVSAHQRPCEAQHVDRACVCSRGLVVLYPHGLVQGLVPRGTGRAALSQWGHACSLTPLSVSSPSAPEKN